VAAERPNDMKKMKKMKKMKVAVCNVELRVFDVSKGKCVQQPLKSRLPGDHRIG